MHLNSFNTIINDGLKYIVSTFIINPHTKNIVCVCRVHSCLVFTFLNNIQTIIQHSFGHCPIITMGDFNVDILKDHNQAKKKENY
jgi:hypothetical protein